MESLPQLSLVPLVEKSCRRLLLAAHPRLTHQLCHLRSPNLQDVQSTLTVKPGLQARCGQGVYLVVSEGPVFEGESKHLYLTLILTLRLPL